MSQPSRRHPSDRGGLASAVVIGSAFLSLAATVVLTLAPLTRPDVRTVADQPPQRSTGVSSEAATGADGQARTRAGARAAARDALAAYASGRYGRFHDLWSSAGKRLISRQDYVRLHERCPQPGEGTPFEIRKVTVFGDRAKVRAARGRSTYIFEFVYQREAWRYVPTARQRREYARDVAEIIAARRDAGRGGRR